MNTFKHVGQVAQQNLCCTCGGCSAVCSVNAITFQETVGGYYLPKVDDTLCTNCGLCVSVCPGLGFNQALLDNLPEDPFIGNAQAAYVGRANDQHFFENAQSGGIVSALLAHALETGQIKAAVTVRMEPGNPPKPMVQIAQTRAELLNAQKSKYCPVPVLSILRDLKNDDCPVAIVGLPCHIHGLQNLLEKQPKLQSKIAFTIGLVCERTLTLAGLEYLLEKSALPKTTPLQFIFRDKSLSSGYPGDIHIFSENGGMSITIPSAARMQIKSYFTPARCRLCFDKMNVFSDITAGDPHGISGIDRKNGESLLVVRSDLGRQIVDDARRNKKIDIHPVDYQEAVKGQGIEQKRQQWRGYTKAWKMMGYSLPNYCDSITHQTSMPEEITKYEKDIAWSLNLDQFESRRALIRFVQKDMERSKLKRNLKNPLGLLKSVIRKIRTIPSRLKT